MQHLYSNIRSKKIDGKELFYETPNKTYITDSTPPVPLPVLKYGRADPAVKASERLPGPNLSIFCPQVTADSWALTVGPLPLLPTFVQEIIVSQ